jgi:hypothetical protein
MVLRIKEDDEYFDDEVESSTVPSWRSRKLFGAVAITIAALVVKTSLAANISLGSTSNEFGQGVQVLTSCSGSNPITITPKSSFVNNSGGTARFSLIGYQISNIPASCSGYQFQMNAFDSSTSTPLSIFNTSDSDSIILNKNGNFFTDSSVQGETVTALSTSSYSVDFSNPIATPNNISKFTLQSQNNSLNGPFTYYDDTKMTSGGVLNSAPGVSPEGPLGSYAMATAFTATAGGTISGVDVKFSGSYSSQGANNPTAYIYSDSSKPASSLGSLNFSSINGNYITFSTNTPITVPAKFWLVISTPSGNSALSLAYWSSSGSLLNIPVATTWNQLPGAWLASIGSVSSGSIAYTGLLAITRIYGS